MCEVDKRILLKGQLRICPICNEEKELTKNFQFHRGSFSFKKTCKTCEGAKRRATEKRIHTHSRESYIGQMRRCGHCKLEKEITDNYDWHYQKGYRYVCKECNKLYKRLRNKAKREGTIFERPKKSPVPYTIEDKATHVMRIYSKEDEKKGRSCNLSLEFVKSCISDNCEYCGFPATGLDRINNNIGHNDTNSIPCCWECNKTRMDRYSYEEMLQLGSTIREIKLQRLIT